MVVAVDNATLRQIGERPPFARQHYADVVNRLREADVSVIALDVAFPGITTPDDDEELVEALGRAGRAVVSVTQVDRDGGTEPLAGIAQFAEVGVTPGATALPTDPAATIRTFPVSPGPVESFATAVARVHRGGPRIVPPSGALIVYPGPAGSVPTVSVADVLDRRVGARELSGKIVVIGPTAPLLNDLHRVPVHGTMSGAEIQAAATGTALDGFPLRTVSSATSRRIVVALGCVLPLLVLSGMLESGRRRRVRDPDAAGLEPPLPAAVLGVGGLVAGAWLVVAQIAYANGRVLEVTSGLVAICAATATTAALAAVLRRRAEDRLRDRLTDAEADDAFIDRVLAADPDDLLGSTAVFDGYRLVSRVKEGGMGRVYRAVQQDLDREVALKLIHRQHAHDPRYRERFLSEARLAASVEHPNVVPIFAVGEHHGLLYIAMQWVRGQDLEDALRAAGRLQPAFAGRLIVRVAGALDAAASRGVVHGDVKPANVILPTEDVEHPYLTDFGIARPVGSRGPGGERWVGTKEYVSPEQVSGGEVDSRADTYSLAAVLFRCLTGEVPFRADNPAAVLRMHREASRPRATDRSPDLPAGIDAVLQRAMAIDPDDRYTSASAFAADAMALLGDAAEVHASAVPEFVANEQTDTL